MNKTKKMCVSGLLLALGTVLHYIMPPIFGVKPDMLLICLFGCLIINKDNGKMQGTCALVAGLLAAVTTGFPGGQIPNIIDKIITSMLISILILVLDKTKVSEFVKIIIICTIGTFVSGIVFLASALLIVGLPAKFTVLVLTVVLPATIINLIAGVVALPLIKTIK